MGFIGDFFRAIGRFLSDLLIRPALEVLAFPMTDNQQDRVQEGIEVTIQVLGLSFALGIVLSLLFGVARLSEHRFVRGFALVYVEFFRGVANPMGIKIGPGMTPEWLLDLLRILNPDNQPGRITLIHRMGAGKVGDALPPLIDAVQRAGALVLWMCDPMHGNTETASNGRKTRRLENIEAELRQAFELHSSAGTVLGGVHLELTGENVTECVGGARGLDEADLDRSYRTQVDPRLNYEQAMELAMLITQQAAA